MLKFSTRLSPNVGAEQMHTRRLNGLGKKPALPLLCQKNRGQSQYKLYLCTSRDQDSALTPNSGFGTAQMKRTRGQELPALSRGLLHTGARQLLSHPNPPGQHMSTCPSPPHPTALPGAAALRAQSPPGSPQPCPALRPSSGGQNPGADGAKADSTVLLPSIKTHLVQRSGKAQLSQKFKELGDKSRVQ